MRVAAGWRLAFVLRSNPFCICKIGLGTVGRLRGFFETCPGPAAGDSASS